MCVKVFTPPGRIANCRRMLHLCDIEIQAGGQQLPPLVAVAPCFASANEQVGACPTISSIALLVDGQRADTCEGRSMKPTPDTLPGQEFV